MRRVWIALIGGALAWCSRSDAADRLPLHECQLRHPLRMASPAARCGTLSVPENPGAPGGSKLDLSVAVVPALNQRSHAAPLFLIAGGPGQAAMDLYASYSGVFAPINRNHDIVLLDQRGTGSSGALMCRYLDDWRATEAGLADVSATTRRCLAELGERVRYYTSSVAVGDLEEVRRALGYGPIDLYGSSYGTRVAELYMRRYRATTDAVILDGVTYPEQAIGPDTPFDGERALDIIVTRCEHTADCASAFPSLRDELRTLRRRFGPEKLPLTLSDPGNGQPLPLEFNRLMLNAALRLLSYNAAEAALLPVLLHEAATGNAGPLALQTVMLARQVGDQLASGMQNSVICSEDAPFFQSASIAGVRTAGTYQGSDQLDAIAEICRLWPRGPVDPELHNPLRSDVPTLLLSGEADPVTPPANADRAAVGLSNHRLLVMSGEGHGQLATGCMPSVMARFLDTADPSALDTSCLERHRPAPFFVDVNGPPP